jgi:GNAT superfamily N-acetyltransferase
MQIRVAEPGDIETIARFNQAMALETENKKLASETILPGVTRLIESTDNGFYLVAEENQVLLGCLGITFEWSDWRNAQFWWIQSVYVDTNNRRRGVFSALYKHVNQLARSEADVCGIRLYVEKENVNAMQTYLALGMVETPYRLMEVEFS